MLSGLHLNRRPDSDFDSVFPLWWKHHLETTRPLKGSQHVPDNQGLHGAIGPISHEHRGAAPDADQVVITALPRKLGARFLKRPKLKDAPISLQGLVLTIPPITRADHLKKSLSNAAQINISSTEHYRLLVLSLSKPKY